MTAAMRLCRTRRKLEKVEGIPNDRVVTSSLEQKIGICDFTEGFGVVDNGSDQVLVFVCRRRGLRFFG